MGWMRKRVLGKNSAVIRMISVDSTVWINRITVITSYSIHYTKLYEDVNFVVCNTDAQALANSPVPVKIQLGESLTEGRGAGNKPAKGRESAIENIEDIAHVLEQNTKMVFVTAGMGGGTGTGVV